MLNNEAKLLENALCSVCVQQQAYLIVYHDMATMLAQREGLSVRKRQIISAAAILHASCGCLGMKMVDMLEANYYVPTYRRAILELVYALAEPEESKEAQVLHDALLLTECMLYPAQVRLLKEQIISKTAQKLLIRYF